MYKVGAPSTVRDVAELSGRLRIRVPPYLTAMGSPWQLIRESQDGPTLQSGKCLEECR